MNDMSLVIVPKSDQINAEDFIAGPATFRIEGVAISPGTEQPVSIKLEGEQRVWRPCKSMSRVLVGAWGADATAYVGRSVTLYRDPNVKWGGLAVGGIRISHMTHIEREMVMALTATKGKRAPHIVKPLSEVVQHQRPTEKVDKVADGVRTLIARIGSVDPKNLVNITDDDAVVKQRAWLAKNRPELSAQVDAAIADKRPKPDGDDPFGLPQYEPEGRPDAEMGEAHIEEESPADAKQREILAKLAAAENVDQLGAIMAEHRGDLAGLGEDRANAVWAEKNRLQHAMAKEAGR